MFGSAITLMRRLSPSRLIDRGRGFARTPALAGVVALAASGALTGAIADGRSGQPRAAAAAAAPGAADLQISSDSSASNPDAFSGVLVWSRLSAAPPNPQSPSRYRLAMRTAGVVRDLPVADSTTQFSPEIGPRAHGDAAVVYDRCSNFDPRQGPSGCAMYIYSLKGGTERAIATRTPHGCRDAAPSVWGKNIIFVRSSASNSVATCPARRRGLYVLAGTRVRLVRRGTTNGTPDLRGKVIASTDSTDGLDSRLRLDFLGRRPGFLIYRDNANSVGGVGAAESPELIGRYLYWQATNGGESGASDLIYRARAALGASCATDARPFKHPAGAPDGQLNGIAVDGATVYYARSAFSGGPNPPGGLFQATSPPPTFTLGHGFWASRSRPLGRECGNFSG